MLKFTTTEVDNEHARNISFSYDKGLVNYCSHIIPVQNATPGIPLPFS
jgi:hypothetical protein